MSRQTKWMALSMMFLMGCPKDPEPPGPFEPDDSPYDASFERITTGPYHESPGSWSPDSRLITFTSDRDEHFAIWVVDVETKELWKVSPDEFLGGSIENPDFSPDGTTIVYDVTWGGLYTVPVEGGESTLLYDNGTTPTWSPDGTRIAFFGGWDLPSGFGIYTIALLDNHVEQISPLSVDLIGKLRWSPDGSLIACSYRTEDVPRGSHIYTVSSDGGTPTPIFPPGAEGESTFDWFPTGKKIIFPSDREGATLWTYDLDLQEGPTAFMDELATDPVWAPNERMLALLICVPPSVWTGDCNIWVKHF